MNIEECVEEAQEALKRVDHTVFVSLKYIRTAEVMHGALERLRSAFEHLFDAILLYEKESGSLQEIPRSPREKLTLLRTHFKDDLKMLFYVDFYDFLRDLVKAPYGKREEYRRHVTMVVDLGKLTVEVNIDNLEDNYDKIGKGFLEFTEIMLGFKERE